MAHPIHSAFLPSPCLLATMPSHARCCEQTNWPCRMHIIIINSSSLTPPLCLTPVQCPDLEISTLRLPGSGYRVPRRAHLSDDCSVPAIVRSSAPHCRSFDSNGAVLGPKFQKLPHSPSHWGLAKHKLMNLEGSNPSSACQWDGPQSYGACGHQNNSQTMV